jgi:CheY-like chemotaxis protein
MLTPNEEEREGYVPNVVYSCGSIIHGDELVVPYAMSDTASTFASVPLEELFSRLIPSGFKKGKKPEKGASKARILVVEDEVINQKIISNILKSDDYEVEIAPDGIVALMQIAKERFDLILSDIAMPNFDGYQLLDYMKQNNIEIPVVFISGYTSEEDEIKGLRMGAVEYIKKPIEKDLLLLRLGRILKK